MTERINHIKEIERQNKKFHEISWIQSHKVRGPLATILGLVNLFKDKEISVSTADIIQGISVSSEQLDIVIRAIVDKSSILDRQYTSTVHLPDY